MRFGEVDARLIIFAILFLVIIFFIIYTLCIKLSKYKKKNINLWSRIRELEPYVSENKRIKDQNKQLYDQVEKLANTVEKLSPVEPAINRIYSIIFPGQKYHYNREELENAVSMFIERANLVEHSYSNLDAIPYMAEIMADYSTHELEILAQKLNWGHSAERAKKVESLLDLKRKTKEMIQESNVARYELAYLLEMFPVLEEYLNAEFSDLPKLESEEFRDSSYDRTRDYLSIDEYNKLSTVEKNQLALDRYVASHKKTKWQIGRDYELFIGYVYRRKGYSVDTCGSYLGVNDLGRDLICKKDDTVLIVQCKYWSEIKTIHENHIAQLYGTVIEYCIENKKRVEEVKGILITNISLSETAKRFAEYLGIEYRECIELGNYPRIKCNIGHNEFMREKIYHLPFDQQYDSTIISGPDEFYAFTVKEAEDKGFRRAYKWHGQ